MKLLFYAGHEFLSDQRIGGRHLSFRNYQLLCRIFGEENVYIITFCREDISGKAPNVKVFEKHRNRLEQYYNCIWMRNGYSRKTEKEIVSYLMELQPDIMFFDHTFTGGILEKLGKEFTENKMIISYLHNVEKNHVWDKVVHENILYYIPYLSYFRNEKILMEKSDIMIGLNKRDQNEVEKIYKRKMDYLLPITYQDRFCMDCVEKEAGDEKEIKMLFVGAYFGPNVQGMRWFIKNVLPFLAGKVKLEIVGKDMELVRGEFQSTCVDVIGTVDETDPYYYRADLVVMPLLYGNGMKTKTAEAMMYGKYIIGTQEALEGYDISDLDAVKVCKTDQEFIKEINLFLQDKSRKKYIAEVRQRFLEQYESGQVKKDFETFLKMKLKKRERKGNP